MEELGANPDSGWLGPIKVFSVIIGWTYFFAWSISFYP